MKKILIIDDNETNLFLMEKVLSKHIHEAELLLAHDPIKGILMAKDKLPDAILLDLNMPLMNGFDVCKVLKEDSTTSHIPIILCTIEKKSSENIVKGFNIGADAFVNRPIKDEELSAQIRAMLRIKQAEDDLKNETEKYRVMTETLSDAICIINLKGEITFVSPGTLEIFGFTNKSDVLSLKLIDTIIPEHQVRAQQTLDKVRKEHSIRDAEFKFIRSNGTEFYGELSASLIKSSNGEPRELIAVIKDITERKNSEYEILEYQRKLKRLNLDLTKVEESERRNIAMNLHDGLGQTISIAHIKLSSLLNASVSEPVEKVIKETIELIYNAIQESRTLTYDLSPPILFELGLVAALEWRIEQVKEKFNMTTQFVCDDFKMPFPNEINILLYRIINELVLNVIKHAEAKEIKLEIYHDPKNIYFSISDNGKGYSYPPKKQLSKQSGLGLFSINERLESIKGQLQVESVLLKGTKTTIIIPNSDFYD